MTHTESMPINGKFRLAQWSIYAAMGFIICAVLPNAIAGKYAFIGIMVILLLAQLLRRELTVPSLSWINVSLYAIVAWSALSTALSPMPVDALSNFRKETLPFLLAYALIVCQKPAAISHNRITRIAVGSLILGFTGKEVLAVYAGIQNGFVFSIYEAVNNTLPKFLDFFATDTLFYLPILLAVCLFWPIERWQRWFVSAVTVVAISIIVMSGVRATFLAALPLVICFALIRYWQRKWLLTITLALIVGAAALAKNHISNLTIQRYYTIFSSQTYQFGNDGSVTERKAILKAVWDLSRDRLWLGYGPGWKKLPEIAERSGYMQRWATSNDTIDRWAHRYFLFGTGRVNPHNIYAQTLFEIGIPGLLAYLSLLLAVLVSGIRGCFKSVNVLDKSMAFAAVAFVCIYGVFGMAGGVWLPIPLLVLMITMSQNISRSSSVVK